MIYDSGAVIDGTVVDATICIVGAGAAGLTLATRLASAGVQVLLAESGDMELDPTTQALYQTEDAGVPYLAGDACRLRMFGGSTNHWTGWTRPLDPADFSRREWVTDSGWPFSAEELTPYYRETESILDLGRHEYDAGYWETLNPQLNLQSVGDIEPAIARHSPPTRFRKKYRDSIASSENVDALLNCNLVDLVTDSNGTAITSAHFKTLGGRHFEVRAKTYVLATGGIENARILLACRRQHEHGLGNQHDLVGRYFADHYGFNFGRMIVTHPAISVTSYRTQAVDAGLFGSNPVITPGLKLSGQKQASAKLLSFATILTPWMGEHPASRHYNVDPDHSEFDLHGSAEIIPCYQSRIRLSEQKDALGIPRAIVDLKVTADQDERVMAAAVAFAKEAGKAGIGRVRVPQNPEELQRLPGHTEKFGSHHIGTTRMHQNPRFGVVDPNGRVHSVRNLYMAGSSVFPTSGYAQPTFTIVALALRLAAHLREMHE